MNPRLAKGNNTSSLELKPTYICFSCSNIASYDERDSHKKEHSLCKTPEKPVFDLARVIGLMCW